MMRIAKTRFRLGRVRSGILAVLVLCLLASVSPLAYAVVASAGPTTTLSSYYAGATDVTYEFGTFAMEAGETLFMIEFTFTGDANVTAATLLEPAGTLSVSGQTVSIAVSPTLPPSTEFVVRIGGVTNPTTPGDYPLNGPYTRISFSYKNAKLQTKTDSILIAHYTITEAPFLTMTIPTADIDFGTVEPDAAVPYGPGTIQVDVTSNYGYTLTRETTGDVASLGLVITGDAAGSKNAGTSSYYDAVTILPDWNTPAGVPLVATVTYTAAIP
ncbi:MAG: hypothetical protein Q7J82_03550 [Coriobacteriia bacterium]|nr:hypothetical protein [Coriobacteriia bacterium]